MDVTDLESPVEIALTSHIGEAHTVNVDPKRPHIAYAVTSDVIGVDDDGVRANESGGTNLDGFEVVDLSSCMDFPEGTTVGEKREACRPEVYRFRYPSIDIAIGHTNRGEVYGCHELEVYPDDTLTCAAGGALIAFDLAGAFDDNGTPDDFTDDVPRGEPLPCATRPSTTADPVFGTAALVTDCVEGGTDEAPVDLTVQGWLAAGAPALEGVEHLGTAHHQGRGAGEQLPVDDIDFDHEAEFTASGRFLVATDERGGGVVPPDSTCSPGVDNPVGNGGVHAYAVDRLDTTPPGSPEEAFDAYARTPEGDKAVFRAEPRAPGGTFCTAHVLQQLPGENRIVMGWYTQGTQIVDIVEHEDGSFEFVEAAFLIPEGANQWVSHVFDAVDNPDGTVTYTGVAADFGRQAIDVYRVTLPPAPEPLPPVPGGPDFPGADPAPTPTPTDPGVPGGPLVRRIDGGGRVETAVSVSQEAFPDGADTVTLARADDYADALTGGPLAAQLDGPLLLTQRDQLSAPTAEEIDRLGADEVVVFGGDEAVEASVLAELDPALTVRRVEGPNRFATAGAVAADLAASAGPTTTAFLVEGANADPARGWPDAVPAGPYAAAQGQPILLGTQGSLPGETADALVAGGTTETVVVGGPDAVGDVVVADLDDRGHGPRRLAGATRFDTSAAVYQEAVAAGAAPALLFLARSDDFADALVAGPAVASLGGTLLLVDPADLDASPAPRDVIADQAGQIDEVVLLGGDEAIAPTVEEQVRALLAEGDEPATAAAVGTTGGSRGSSTDGALLLLGLTLVPAAGLVGRRRRLAG